MAPSDVEEIYGKEPDSEFVFDDDKGNLAITDMVWHDDDGSVVWVSFEGDYHQERVSKIEMERSTESIVEKLRRWSGLGQKP